MSSVQFDERAERVAFVHSSREESPNRRDSKMLVALLAMQTVVLIALLCGGVYAYREVIDNANKIDAVVTIVKNPSQLISKPQLVHSLVTLMQNTTGEFFFGSEDGAIPNFINNLMLFDFGSWGLEISNFAADVTNTFEVNSNSSLCSQPVQCTPYSEVQCANGDVKWCDYTGQVNCAPVSTCVGPSIVTAASVVASVARRIGEMQQLNGSTDGTAAFSEGVFRMDFLVDWVRSQMSSPNWKDAGEMCRAFVSQVRAVDWKGNYNDANDEFSQWDATEQVNQVTIYVDQVCDGLRQIAEHQRPPVAKKQHRISGPNHHSLP